jgi:hypothetical protein
MKFYPADWRGDPRLRLCSLTARGLWIDLMSYMHEGEPYGYLTIDGAQPDPQGIAALVGRPVPEVKRALSELQTRHVFSRAASGAIYSRRMVRDKAKAERDARNGRAGGNPQLSATDSAGVNPPDKAQSPETRLQSPDSSLRSEGRAGETRSSRRQTAPWPADLALTDERRAAARKRGLLDSEIAREWDRCKNHARSSGRRSADWDAAWDNWCLKAVELLGRQPNTETPAAVHVFGFYAAADSAELAAWDAHARATRGRNCPRDRNGGWRFPAQWPPQASQSPAQLSRPAEREADPDSIHAGEG